MVKHEGTSFWVHVQASTVQDADGAPVCRVVLSDITQRKHAEEQQHHVEAQFQQAQKMDSLGSLAGGVAHDMNNVLGAILGLASANLELQPAGSPAYQAFDTISKAAIRGGKTVKSLLNFAHQGPGEERELDLNAILREEVLLHHEGCRQGYGAGPVHGLQHRDGPPRADGDPERAGPGNHREDALPGLRAHAQGHGTTG